MRQVLSLIKGLVRGFTENQAALRDDAEDPLLRPLILAVPPELVADAITRWVQTKWLWELVSREPEQQAIKQQTIKLHLIRRSVAFRFIDDIHVHIRRDDDAVRLDAEGRSRFGKGDLGQNRRSLKALVRAVQQAVQDTPR